MDPSGQADELWEGLNLGGLLDDLARENESALAQAKKLQARRDPFKKHNKMLKNPAYSVLMERYGAAPPKPKLLAKATLSRLSDPVKGRHMDHDNDTSSPQRVRVVRDTKNHPRKQNKAHSSAVNNRHRSKTKNHPYDHSPIRKEAWADASPSPTRLPRPSASSPVHETGVGGGDTFFITGTNDEGEDYNDDFESPPPSPATLRKKMQHAQDNDTNMQGADVSPICVGEQERVYSPPDIYSPRTKEALRVSFQKEQIQEQKLLETSAPSKKTFNPLKFTKPIDDPVSEQPATRKSNKLSSVGVRKSKPTKLTKGKPKTKTKTITKSKATRVGGKVRSSVAASSGVAKRPPRGSSLERQSKVGLRKSNRASAVSDLKSDDLIFDGPSKRVQLLSNKMQANKMKRSSNNGVTGVTGVARGRGGGDLMRSSSVKGIRDSQSHAVRDGREASLGGGSGSRSAPTLPRRQVNDPAPLPSIPSSSTTNQKPSSLPSLRAKNLLGRKGAGVSPAMQEKYAVILQESKVACRGDAKMKTLKPIIEKQGISPEDYKKMDRKLKNRAAIKKKKETKTEVVMKSPGSLAAEEKEKRKEEERIRREEQEKRIEARAHASKKKEEMDYRNKIRKAAEENAAKDKRKTNYETVDEKLVQMFKTHCARVTSKLSQVDKLSADFQALKEFDGYSSMDRQKLRASTEDNSNSDGHRGGHLPQLTQASPRSPSGLAALRAGTKDGSQISEEKGLKFEALPEQNNAFLSKPLMM